MRILNVAAAAAMAISAVAAPAVASTLVVGNGSSNNSFPFGGSYLPNPTTYQQIYAASKFGTAPISISSISFKLLSGTVADGTFTLSLSTSARTLTNLDGVDFASNVGADSKQIFSGTLAGQLVGDMLTFNFAPFNYDPTKGNLLLNVGVAGLIGNFGANFTGTFAADTGATGTYSRATDFSAQIPTAIGLQTFFNVGAAVPEPATWAMLVTGFGFVGYGMRRRAKLTAVAA
jgi:hypothetical protein